MTIIQKLLEKKLSFKKTTIKKKINLVSKKKITTKKKSFFKLKKKWRFWRLFKKYFISSKKITFYKKLQWRFNNIRIIWHQLIKSYLPKTKLLLFKYTKKVGHNKFGFFLRQLELRLSIILLRSRFYYKLINSYNAIKMNLILINGLIINKINFLLFPLDLFQKRRSNIIKKYFKKKKKRLIRLKWRKFRWKKARYIFWKIRRISHFNMYWVKKQNTIINYLEINYKIPAGILLKQPFLKELLLNKNPKILTSLILKKIYFLY